MRLFLKIFVCVLMLLGTTPAMAQHAILYRDWKNCISLMVEEQIDRGSMVPLVMMLNEAELSCKPEADLFADDYKARSPGMSTRAYVTYINQIREKIRAEVASDHKE